MKYNKGESSRVETFCTEHPQLRFTSIVPILTKGKTLLHRWNKKTWKLRSVLVVRCADSVAQRCHSAFSSQSESSFLGDSTLSEGQNTQPNWKGNCHWEATFSQVKHPHQLNFPASKNMSATFHKIVLINQRVSARWTRVRSLWFCWQLLARYLLSIYNK